MPNSDRNNKIALSEENFEQLFKESRSAFIRIANSYVHDIYVAEDIVDDSFIKMWEKRDEIMTENYKAYTYRTVVNKCLDYLKAAQIQSRVKQNIVDTTSRMQMHDIISLQKVNPSMLFAKEIKKIFYDSINNMPKLTKRVFVENRMNGLTYSEIVEKLGGGITMRQVTSHMQYALKILRNALNDYL